MNYFIGNDASKWRTNIQTSKAVLYRELYPNIDLKVYGIERQIEYDFVVKPGGEASDISLEYQDIEETRIDKEGNLVIKMKFGELEHAKPVCYQVIEGERVKVKAEFKNIENNTYGFEVKKYNRDYELIIDPLVLVYSSYLGGSDSDKGSAIAVDSEGAAYVSGWTVSIDFPTKNPIQGSKAEKDDVFITKINSAGDKLIYSTYLGGSVADWCNGIAVDSEGAAYVTGGTESTDFPAKNPIQGSYGGGPYDVFITKVNTSGSALIYSTYLGGSEYEEGMSIAVDSEGAAYVAGYTVSRNFPTQNPIQGSYGGGWGDVFITKVNTSGSAIIYSTYLGGSVEDWCNGIAVDSEGAAYVGGYTGSANFPTQNPIQSSLGGVWDAFIAKINASGSALLYSTYLGGSGNEGGKGIAVDSEGAAYVGGYTGSANFPTQNPIQGSYGGGKWDAFITKVNTSGSAIIYSTYLGGSLEDLCNGIAVDSEGAAYVTGGTESVDFPTQNPIQGSYGGGEHDAFITKIGSPTPEGIRIVSWNILDYPDINGEPREEYIQSVLEYLSPDILVVQEMTSSYGVDQFLKNILKHISEKYKAAKFFDGPDTDNALFYDKSKINLQSRLQIPTSFRDISEYSLKIKKGPGKESTFKIYSVHFTEGLEASDKKQRKNEANTLRTYLNGLPLGSLFLVCGTFNMTGSGEKANKILTGDQINNIGRVKDPINKAGKWHDNKKSRLIHTESTRKSKFGGGARGGLDDRFDMILISYSLDQNGKLIYRPGSCVVCGNDGEHLNKAINKPKNKVVSPEIANALYEASDHLPVIIDLVPQNKSSEKDRLN